MQKSFHKRATIKPISRLTSLKPTPSPILDAAAKPLCFTPSERREFRRAIFHHFGDQRFFRRHIARGAYAVVRSTITEPHPKLTGVALKIDDDKLRVSIFNEPDALQRGYGGGHVVRLDLPLRKLFPR